MLVEDVLTKEHWIEEYLIMPTDDPYEWAKRAVAIYNNGKGRFAHEHKLIRIRTITDHSLIEGRTSGLPWIQTGRIV